MIARELFESVKVCEIDPLLYIKFCLSLLSEEQNEVILQNVLVYAIYTANNYLSITSQTNNKSLLYKTISEKLYLKFPNLKTNLINYMCDTINSFNRDHIKFFIHKLCSESSYEEEINEQDSNISQPNTELENVDKKTLVRVMITINESDKLTNVEKHRSFEHIKEISPFTNLELLKIQASIPSSEVSYYI